MSMGMGMGHWLFWGLIGFVALMALMAMGSWLRRNKARYVDENGSAGSSPSSRTVTSPSAIITDVNGRTSSWGFWPWALISLLVLGVLAWVVWNTSLTSGAATLQWILWSLLGLAGLFSFLGLAQMTRRHPLVDEKRGSPRGLGFITLISGLVLGLASWFVWQPKVAGLAELQGQVDTQKFSISKLKKENTRLAGLLAASRKNIDEIERLKGVVARLNKDNKSLGAENTRLAGLVSKSRANEDEITRLKAVITRMTQGNADLKAENNRLKALASSGQSNEDEIARLNGVIARLTKSNEDLGTENSRISGLIGTYKNDNQVLNAKIASLEAELARLRNRPATATPAPAPAPAAATVKKRPTPLALIHKYNQDETKLRLTSGDYNMVRSPKTEMVNGKRGHYYNIFLKNPATGKGYKFASASYSKIDNEGACKQSLDRAISDIRGALDGQRTYQIYVQGKASAGRYSGKMADGFDYSTIEVMENKGGIYGPELVQRHYGPTISNDDLPNLRGAFLQEFLAKNYKISKPLILDGKVSKSKDPSEQAVAVILFVED